MISYNYSTKEITVDSAATLRSVYSDAMNIFAQAAQMDDLIPLRADTPTLYTMINGWSFTTDSIQYLRGAALQDASGNNIWTNVKSLGTLVAGTYLYVEQDGNIVFTSAAEGHIDRLIKTKDAGVEIDGQNLTAYARKFQQEYAQFSATGGPVIASFPLSTKADSQLDIPQETIEGYTGLSITWGSVTKDAGDGAGAQPYNVVVDCGGYTLKEAYNWVQFQLLSASDIDAGAGTKIGKLTDSLISFTGTGITAPGVWFENFAAADANKIKYTDANGVQHSPPQSIAISISSSVDMAGGRVVVYRLGAEYNSSTYTPASIVSTLLDTTLDSNGNASTSLTYVADWPVVIRVRKAGRKPFEVGTTLTNQGLSVTSINEEDTIYQA